MARARTPKKPARPVAAADRPAAAAGDGLSLHRPWLEGLLRRLTGDPDLAQDLAQDTVLKATAHAGPRDRDKTRAWLAAIAVNAARDHGRKVGRRPEVSDAEAVFHVVPAETPDPEALLLHAEMAACIAEFLDRLSSPQREVVALHDLVGLTHAEIAQRLDVSEANSRVLLHRGRATLKAWLDAGCVLD